MSSLQQLSLRQSHVRERRADRSQERLRAYEASLLSELFSRNGREDGVQRATPPGYAYVPAASMVPVFMDTSGPVMQIAAHPGDGPDFFYATYLKMAGTRQDRNEYHEVLLTDGEGGVDGWPPERTRQVRIAEAYAGAEMVGSRLHFLGYPDGSLASLAEEKRSQLITMLAALIGDIQPCLLVVHPPKNDHLDHAHSFLLTLAALELHARAGGSAPTLLIHDVEFGLQQESICMHSTLDPHTHLYPLHTPGLLVDISSTHQTAQCALHKHKTQMFDPVSGQPKAYADLIDTLARVRGLQLITGEMAQLPRGQGFSHVVIPGVTSEHNILLQQLPESSIYLLSPTCRAAKR